MTPNTPVAFAELPGLYRWVAKNPIRPGRHSGSAALRWNAAIHITDVLADPNTFMEQKTLSRSERFWAFRSSRAMTSWV